MPFNNAIQQLQRLLSKYLSGKATPTEKAFVEKWYDHFDTVPTHDLEADTPEREMQLLEAMHQRIHQQPGARVIPFYKRTVTKVAAAVLVIITGSLLWRQHSSPAKTPAVTRPIAIAAASDKAPGTNKAVLTLASGQQIVLGNSSSNAVHREGNISFIQLDSGSIAYQSPAHSNAPVTYNTITTPSGGQYHIVLADGTKVWLNSASSLKFPTRFSAGSRLVELDGEGYFEVAKDAAHPFKVKIDQMQVEVLGTSFNVMAYQNEGSSKTTLVDGAVKLVNGKNNSLLQPGQQGAVNKETGNFSVVNADLEEVLAWKEGKFRFAGADIQTIMRQIARWYDIAVVYKGALPQKRLSGAFSKKQNVANLFEALEDVEDVHFDMSGNTVTVTAATKK